MNKLLEQFMVLDRFEGFKKRRELCAKYAWAIPNDAALEIIRKHAPLIEIGAGKGYWASLLGCDILCFDCHAKNPSVNTYVDSGESFHPVARGGADRIEDHPERTLFLCWPPYNTSMAADCLAAYDGGILVFVGEGRGGCTGNDDFWEAIYAEWCPVGEVAIPQWDGIHDRLMIFKRI